jgi:pyruvate kinase
MYASDPRCRQVCAAKGSYCATLLDTKGPEIRTAMLREGTSILLEAGQSIVIEAVGDKYTEFEGYKNESGTCIGISYEMLCQALKPGSLILLADGQISIEVTQILSDKKLSGKVLNTHELGQRKNCNLPSVHVDLPVLLPKDVEDLQTFACHHCLDFVAASFVQSKEDVLMIRRVLDEAGGASIRIIAKIENMAGLQNFTGANILTGEPAGVA